MRVNVAEALLMIISQNIFVKVCIAGVWDCLKTSICPLSQVQRLGRFYHFVLY